MGAPPLNAGGVKLMLACPLPGVAATMTGACGGEAGTVAAVGVTMAIDDAGPSPALLVAVTLQP